MPQLVFDLFAYFGMVCAAVLAGGGLVIFLLSLRKEAP